MSFVPKNNFRIEFFSKRVWVPFNIKSNCIQIQFLRSLTLILLSLPISWSLILIISTSQPWTASLQHRLKTRRSRNTLCEGQSRFSLLHGQKESQNNFPAQFLRNNSAKSSVIFFRCSQTRGDSPGWKQREVQQWNSPVESEAVEDEEDEDTFIFICKSFYVQFSAAEDLSRM